MASFWKEKYLGKRRKEWLSSISYAEYVIGSSAYKADIQDKKISGDKIEVYVVINHLTSGTTTIKSIRLYDVDGGHTGFITQNTAFASFATWVDCQHC